MGNATVAFDPAATTPDALVATIRRPATAPSCRAPTSRRSRSRPRATSHRRRSSASCARKAIVAGALGAAGDARVDAAHGRGRDGRTRSGRRRRSVHALGDDRADARAAQASRHGSTPSRPPCSRGRCSSLTLGVMAWAGRHFYTRAWAAFRHHSADMNTLVAVGTGAAFLYSVVATVAPGLFRAAGLAPDVYYEAVIIIIALILTGQRVRGARQAADVDRAARARRAAADDRARRAPHRRRRQHRDRRADRDGARGRHRPRAAGRAPARRRRDPLGRERGRRVHADGRVAARREAGGRPRHRRHDQPHRRLPLPRDDARRRQRARADRATHARRAGLARAHPGDWPIASAASSCPSC